MNALRLAAALLSSLLFFGAVSSAGSAPPTPDEPPRPQPQPAADPGAPPVTAENLYENERFWPYRVLLKERWHPSDGGDVVKQRVGVLIRVEPGGVARVDFGTYGKYHVPIEKTDLVDQANRVRLGTLAKDTPNFTHAIRTRMLDPAVEPLAWIRVKKINERPGFLCVFADPGAEGFDDLATALAPLRDRHGVATVLFPIGSHGDAEVAERIVDLEWPVPFLPDYLSEPYLRTLVLGNAVRPGLMLQTNEGRVLYEGDLSLEAVPRLAAALDAGFGVRAADAGAKASRP